MAAVSRIEITTEYADSTKAKITINNIRPENLDIAGIKTKVRAFNTAHGGDLATKMKSANGFNWIGISKVRIVTVDKTVIY